jgi:glycine/D-amino acid oxidase-like deaminating enzyme
VTASTGGRGSSGTDLLVVGAGVMGAWTALEARRDGWTTTLIDAFGAGHSRATSGDETRIIRSSHGPDAFYSRWSRAAREAWIALGEAVGEALFVPAGALWFARADDGFEAASEATLRGLGIPVERLGQAELAARWPQLGVDDLSFAVYEPEAGLLMARRGVAAVTRRFEAEGGRFELAWAGIGRARGRRLLDVALPDGRAHAADQFVFAAGPWLPRLFPEVAGPLIRVTKQDVVFVGPPAGDGRFSAERLPCWVDYAAAFYGIPAVDGRGMKLAPDRYGPVFDPSAGERIVDPESVRLARRYLARRFPDLADAPVVETRVCQYETTPDTHFVIDRHPGYDNVWLVGGGSGHGFKHGPVIGRHVVGRLAGAAPGPGEERFGLGHARHPAANLRTGADAMTQGWADW